MAADQELFPNDPDLSHFEKSAHKNGEAYWWATELMRFLGYDDQATFRSAISRAQLACANLDIPVEDHFARGTNAKSEVDTRLTRFACYLVAMNADVRKPEVARAQAYFVAMAESIRKYFEEAENVMRVQMRGDITSRERSLSGVAKQAGVTLYPLFQNAGYRGMYNMNISELRDFRGIAPDRSPLDFMGKAELAANLFRITQTEERIKRDKIFGQAQSEAVAESVGREVRKTMIRTGGSAPEELPESTDIRTVRKELKSTAKKLKKIDKKK